MARSAPFLTPAEAARRLGVSAKALRLYEQHGLLAPGRTAAGYRAYGPGDIEQAARIAALRALGLGLAEVGRVLVGDGRALETALASHQAHLRGEARLIEERLAKIRALRLDLAEGRAPALRDLAGVAPAPAEPVAAFDLPWPWGGERFELRRMRRLNYVTGPLGSGKLRLAQALAAHVPGAGLLGLDRLEDDGAQARLRLSAEPALRSRVETAMAWLREEGATGSGALLALLAALQAEAPKVLVVDMVEQGLDGPTQQALAAWLRRHHPAGRPLFLFTRSSAILDLEAVGPDQAVILCPANHSPPVQVEPWPGAAGYDSVATCLAPPAVRTRSEGLTAVRAAVSA